MIKKCSSDRLRPKLVEAGYDSATVSKLDRTGLMEAMAQLMMKQSVSGLDSDATTQGDLASEIRFRELALEEKRIEAEQEQKREMRKMELELKMIEEKRLDREAEAEQKRLEREAEQKRLEREAEQMRLEREAEQKRLEREAEQMRLEREADQKRLDREAEYRREQMKLELEMKRLELEGARAGLYEQREGEGAGYDEEALGPGGRGHALDRRTKHFGDTLRHVLPSMPSEISELPQFFDTIEKLYQIYQVPDDLRAKLLIPKLSSRAKSIIVRMTAEDLDRYD